MRILNNYRRGSAILTAIGMGIVLMIIIAGVFSFSSQRMQTTIRESRKAKALALAEAGLEFVVAELSNNYDFVTHEVTPDLKWKKALPNKQTLQKIDSLGFYPDSNSEGTYTGRLGDGEFRVRVGYIPYIDDPDTKNVDERFSYLLVESLGKFDNTIRRVEAVINRRYPAREFLLYDGGFLSLIYGEPGKGNKNVFSTGHLYGHKGVEISRILNTRQSPSPEGPGTDQELDDMEAIISGAGGIFFYSPIKATFRGQPGIPKFTKIIPKNQSFPLSGTYSSPEAKKFGEYPKELVGATPELPADLKPYLKDKHAGMSLPPKPIPFHLYKEKSKTKGIYLSSSDCNQDYAVPNGWNGSGPNSVKAKILDFGSNIRPGNISLPADFNGVIFAEENLVIKGNPGKDIQIVSPKNVFVAGDFNQAGDPSPSKFDEYYGLPQDYPDGGNALESTDYSDEIKAKLAEDAETTGFKNHVAATVIAKERIVYDYRSPIDCFENEIFPYMKYEIAKSIANDTEAEDNCIKHNRSGTINASATDEAGFRTDFKKFFTTFPMKNSSIESSLEDEFAQKYNETSGKFRFDDYDQLCKKVWENYSKEYEKFDSAPLAQASEFGVYKLLSGLRKKLGVPADGNSEDFDATDLTDKPGDFLYFPEMTTNGMFISGGKQNNKYYAGPDYVKLYNEIGRLNNNVGIKHSGMMHMVHRVFGSEINLRLYDVHQISQSCYSPPTRRKVYDPSLPLMGLEDSIYEYAGYCIISWKDTLASLAEYNSF